MSRSAEARKVLAPELRKLILSVWQQMPQIADAYLEIRTGTPPAAQAAAQQLDFMMREIIQRCDRHLKAKNFTKRCADHEELRSILQEFMDALLVLKQMRATVSAYYWGHAAERSAAQRGNRTPSLTKTLDKLATKLEAIASRKRRQTADFLKVNFMDPVKENLPMASRRSGRIVATCFWGLLTLACIALLCWTGDALGIRTLTEGKLLIEALINSATKFSK